VYGSLAIVIIVLALVTRGASRSRQVFAVVCVLEGLLFFTAPFAVRGIGPIWPPDDHVSLGASRYFILPALFLLTALGVGLDDKWSAGTAIAPVWRACLGAWFVVLLATNYSFTNGRSLGPDWQTALAQARASCKSGRARQVAIVVSPGPPWAVNLDCRDVESSAR
jgi:hypothetical protein